MQKNPHVLVVDDDPISLKCATALLGEYGYLVSVGRNASEALAALQDNHFDTVLTDVIMPRVSGIELLEIVHTQYPEIPVILMTGRADLDTTLEAIHKGAFDFLVKPYEETQLVSTVKKGVHYHRLLLMEKNYKHMLEETVRKRTQELSSALRMVKDASKEMIQRLMVAAEYRDDDTGNHVIRIGLYSKGLAEALQMPGDFVQNITFASSMHDIGKIAIPDRILLKPGILTPEEFEVVKTHTTIGEKILYGSSHATIQMAANIAASHHERWDGSGYPHGLKGEDIPIEGRIVLLADHYDALRSKRPYKAPLDHVTAFRSLIEGDERTSPAYFDPQVLNAFIAAAPRFEEIFSIHN